MNYLLLWLLGDSLIPMAFAMNEMTYAGAKAVPRGGEYKGKAMRMKLVAQAVAAIGLLGSGFTHAEGGSDGQLERVTITGSNIKRSISKEGALPVEILKKEDIAKTGASTVVQLLDSLTSITSVTSGTNASSFAPGAASAGLRGMEAKYTLVLLNGRRLATYAQLAGGTDPFTDLNTLPLSVIESVEILRDGASAIYGSDAVAGVINFKTKRNYEGVDSYVRYGQSDDGDGQEQAVGISGGKGNLEKDGFNAMFSFDAYHREPVFYGKHEATKTRDFRRFGGDDNRYLASWGGWKIPGGTYNSIPYCDKALVTKKNGMKICPIDYDQQDDQLAPRTTRYGLLGAFTKKLDANSEFYVELGANQTQTQLQGGNEFLNAVPLVPGNAAYPTDPALLAALQAINPKFQQGMPVTVYRSINEGWPRYTDATSNTYRAVFGYSTYYKEWDLDASVNIGKNQVTNTDNKILASFEDSLINGNAYGGPTYNPFIHGNPSSSVAPYQVQTKMTATTGLQALELKAAKSELFSLPGGMAGFATGLQWWHESLESNPDQYSQQGLILNSAPQSYLKAGRSILAAYGEMNLPVVKNLEVQLALRADRYTDFGSTINPKAAFSYRPLEVVMFRGSATSGFKAPSFTQLHLTRTAYGVAKDYTKCRSMGTPDAACSAESIQLLSGGNSQLKPETNQSFTLGMVLQPTKDLFASVDFYRINQKEVINERDLEDVMNNPGKYPDAIVRKPVPSGAPAGTVGDIAYVNLPYQNAGKLVTSGLDIDVRYDLSLGGYGKLKFENQQSRILSYKDSQSASDPLLEEVDYAVQPRWKNVFTTDYSYDKYTVGIAARTYAGYKNLTQAISNAGSLVGKSERIPSYTAFDLNFSVVPVKNLKIGGGIRNIGNRIPSYFSNSSTPGTFSGSSTDLWGRTYYLNANYRF